MATQTNRINRMAQNGITKTSHDTAANPDAADTIFVYRCKGLRICAEPVLWILYSGYLQNPTFGKLQ